MLSRPLKCSAKGMKIATAAVLLMNAELMLVIIRKRVMVAHGVLFPELSLSATTSRNPVLTNAELNMNIRPTVSTAWLLNPETASSIVRRSVASRIASSARAVTSIGKISLMKRMKATKIIARKSRDSPGIYISPKFVFFRPSSAVEV